MLRVAVVAERKAVALVSHKLDEILHATDVVTILRRGRVVDAMATRDADARTLAQAMVGRPVSLRHEALALGLVEEPVSTTSTVSVPASGPPALRISNAVALVQGRTVLDDLSLDVHAGEIVGVAGVEGNGQAELADVLGSLLTLDGGSVEVDGTVVPTGHAGKMGEAGIGLIPEDRHDAGCVLSLSVADNLALCELGRGAALAHIDRRARRERAAELIAEFGIDCAGPDAPFSSLSGGNQQRVVLARELTAEPTVLVAAQPCRGLDVGAIEFIGQRLRAAADLGIAVLLISNELEEILALADRIVVIHGGRIRGEMTRAEADIERIGLMMGGVDDVNLRSRATQAPVAAPQLALRRSHRRRREPNRRTRDDGPVADSHALCPVGCRRARSRPCSCRRPEGRLEPCGVHCSTAASAPLAPGG